MSRTRRIVADRVEFWASLLGRLAWKIDPGRGVGSWGTAYHPDGTRILVTYMQGGTVLPGHVHRPARPSR